MKKSKIQSIKDLFMKAKLETNRTSTDECWLTMEENLSAILLKISKQVEERKNILNMLEVMNGNNVCLSVFLVAFDGITSVIVHF